MGSKCRRIAAVLALFAFALIPGQARAVFDTVVLDPGHGGWDQGGLRNVKVPEKKMTLLTALAVRDLLQQAGLKVVMTRETDVYIPLSDRVEIGNSHDNAIFVSIHYNADYGSSGNGIETYCARGSNKSMPLRDKIHANLIRRTGARDRGVRTAGFYVLRHSDTVAVLVEGGFLSNPREASKIADEEYRYLLAQCITDGILDYRESMGGSKLPRSKKKSKEEDHPKQEKSKEATPIDESKLPPAKNKTDKSDDAKKKAAAPKPAAAKKPAAVKKPAAAQTNLFSFEQKYIDSAASQSKIISTVSKEAAPKPESGPSIKVEAAPKDTNSISISPPPEAPVKQEIGPKTTTPASEPQIAPPTETSPPVTNQFRASPMGLRN